MTRTGLFREQRLLALLSACSFLPAVNLQSIKAVAQFRIIKRLILRVKLLGGKKKKDTSINSLFAKWIFIPKCQGQMDSLKFWSNNKTCVYHVLKRSPTCDSGPICPASLMNPLILFYSHTLPPSLL